MTHADILVVLPTLGDRLETLEETLRSVDAQRADVQLTLVVVAPPQATEARKLAAGFGAVLVDDPRTGISAAINCGLAARTKEQLYAWIGDDDLFRPGGLRVLQNLIMSKEDAVVAYGGCEYIDAQGNVLWLSAAGKIAQFLLSWGPDLIPHPGSVIRLDALEAIGGFDTSFKYALDLDAFLKLRKHGKFTSTKAPVSAFRWHADSLTVANRLASSLESERAKREQLPAPLRPLSYVWSYPVRWASSVAARRIGKTSGRR
jgi:GT2 family glycosyltransferase